MEITTEKDFLVIRVPLKQNVYDYFGDDIVGTADNIIGLISGDEIGFAYQIDMSYAGKAPQWTDMFLKYWDGEEKFKALCKKLKIDIYEYSICSKCHNPIYGAFTWKDDGEVCFDCERS
jgi:hypothetical protein